MRLYQMMIVENNDGRPYVRAVAKDGSWVPAFAVNGPDDGPRGWVTWRQWREDLDGARSRIEWQSMEIKRLNEIINRAKRDEEDAGLAARDAYDGEG